MTPRKPTLVEKKPVNGEPHQPEADDPPAQELDARAHADDGDGAAAEIAPAYQFPTNLRVSDRALEAVLAPYGADQIHSALMATLNDPDTGQPRPTLEHYREALFHLGAITPSDTIALIEGFDVASDAGDETGPVDPHKDDPYKGQVAVGGSVLVSAPDDDEAPAEETRTIRAGLPQVTLPGSDWRDLMDLLDDVEHTAETYDDLKRRASDAKKDHEAAQVALERALARLRDGRTAHTEPKLPFDEPAPAAPEGDNVLPFGGVHQSDVIAAAHADPEIVALVERLQSFGWDHVDAVIVSGYTQKEREDLIAWMDGFGPRPEIATDPTPEPATEDEAPALDGAEPPAEAEIPGPVPDGADEPQQPEKE